LACRFRRALGRRARTGPAPRRQTRRGGGALGWRRAGSRHPQM